MLHPIEFGHPRQETPLSEVKTLEELQARLVMTKNIRHNGRDLQLRELADDILKGLPADALVASILVNVVIVFINSWMVQMVFTNRYGKSSWTNITFSFIDMAIVLYMSNAFAATFDRHLATFFTAAGLL